jgi:ribosomal protein S18 acetylase RimI-like enzyme
MLVREMTIEDYDASRTLWERSPGVGLSGADTREAVARFLERNPGLSFVAQDGDQLVGTCLAGHDGRRGYIYHLAVAEEHRRQGVGRALTTHCLQALKNAGIQKCHLMVFNTNERAIAFWNRTGWEERVDLTLMSIHLDACHPDEAC